MTFHHANFYLETLAVSLNGRPSSEHGVSCHKCKNKTTETDKSRFRERQKQIKLSRKRGQKHMAGYDGN